MFSLPKGKKSLWRIIISPYFYNFFFRIPSLKTSLLDKKNHSANENSLHNEVHFDGENLRQSIIKENKDLNLSNPSHNSAELKETLKRTNTPNFRKNFNYDTKILDEDSNKVHLNHEIEEENRFEFGKKPLMKVPTFSRNIVNQANNKKNQMKTNSFVVEPPESDNKIMTSLDNIRAKPQSSEKDQEIGQNIPTSPQRTRFFPTGTHKEHSPSPQNLNKIPLKTLNSAGSNPNYDNKSPSNQINEGKSPSNQGKSPSNQKFEGKNPSIQKIIEGKCPSNQKISTDGTDSYKDIHKSLDKICEEESQLASSEKKKSTRPSVITNSSVLNSKINQKTSPNYENKDKNSTVFSYNFQTNLIDFFRNEPSPNSINNINTNNNNINNNNGMAASVFWKNSKKNLSKTSQQSIPSNVDLNNNIISNTKDLQEPFKNNPAKFFHINPNANLISMFKNEQETQNLNLGEDDNHNFVTIDDDGPSPINRPQLFHNENEPERETSLNMSTFENVCSNDITEKSEINRTTIHNVDDISKDLSKYSINADYLNVEYDDKKGRDPSPSNNGNILSGLNSPINQQQGGVSHKNLGFSNMKLPNKTHKTQPNSEENKFLSPTVSKKIIPKTSSEKFKLRSLTMRENNEDSGEDKASPINCNNVSTNNGMPSSISPVLGKKPDQNKLDISNRMPKSPSSFISGKLQRAKTTLEAENSVVHTSKLDVTKDEQGNKKINQYLMIKDLGK